MPGCAACVHLRAEWALDVHPSLFLSRSLVFPEMPKLLLGFPARRPQQDGAVISLPPFHG